MRGLKRLLGLTLLFVSAVSLCACGYNFTGQGTVLGPDPDAVSRLDPAFRTMAIARVENPTIEPWLEPRLRSLIRDEFTRRRFVTWVDKDKATSLLTVVIKKFTRSTSVAGQQDQSLKLSNGMTLVFRVHRASCGCWARARRPVCACAPATSPPCRSWPSAWAGRASRGSSS